ncbi:3-oxoacyl-[acyl-carrier protein] reductase [Bacillus oleivorans]|uniref:3-oxoacyl-[acyl-carrier protein] reductase n=1 Tax=Bacillus oleivorans TaxID=1448271 RepID=A0A285D6A0_9BACI|nr:SDR family oxidoreductase [Bacillus oleivorans]SNX74683.1 3-oxoacyl-[acyl-carrier protein] reductase [Bacillus oleivorans]
MDLGLKNKVAFVCASSKGLGKASALELAKEGAHVVLTGRDEKELQETKKQLQSLTESEVEYVVCDLTKKEDIENAVRYTIEKFNRIDILINNSGGPPSGTFEQFTDEDWYQSFELNLLSYVRCIRAVLPYMKEQNYGKIINLTSTSIKQPIPGLLLSNTFRTGVMGLSKTLATELAGFNILVNTVAPGRILTDRVQTLDSIKAEKTGMSLEEVQNHSKKSIPLGRYGKPEEFGAVVAFIASDKCSYVTGTSIIIDGGMVKSI